MTAVVIQGLAEHKDTLGAPLCPCRHYDDKEAEAEQGYWNCPCVPMRERKVGGGPVHYPCLRGYACSLSMGDVFFTNVMRGAQECHCMLFLEPGSDFAGDEKVSGMCGPGCRSLHAAPYPSSQPGGSFVMQPGVPGGVSVSYWGRYKDTEANGVDGWP